MCIIYTCIIINNDKMNMNQLPLSLRNQAIPNWWTPGVFPYYVPLITSMICGFFSKHYVLKLIHVDIGSYGSLIFTTINYSILSHFIHSQSSNFCCFQFITTTIDASINSEHSRGFFSVYYSSSVPMPKTDTQFYKTIQLVSQNGYTNLHFHPLHIREFLKNT